MSELDKKVKDALQIRLEDLVADHPMNQSDIAKAIGISSGSLSGYINANKEAGICNLVRIADYFNVSTDYLLGRTDVASTDKNIKISCNTTGLDENAVDLLIDFFKEKDIDRSLSMLDMVNILLTDNRLIGFFTLWLKSLIEVYDFQKQRMALSLEELYMDYANDRSVSSEYFAVKSTGYICDRLRQLSADDKEKNNAE